MDVGDAVGASACKDFNALVRGEDRCAKGVERGGQGGNVGREGDEISNEEVWLPDLIQ